MFLLFLFFCFQISVQSGGATFGHQMLGLRLKEGNLFNKQNAFWAFVLIPALARYFRERSRNVAMKLRILAADRDDGSEPRVR